MDNKTNVVISGYYGFNNIGDEAILYTMIEMLKKEIPTIQITVLSNNPKLTEKTYRVKAINRWDIRSIMRCIKNCDMVISGGGSLLQDITSWKTIPYYLGIVKIGLFYKKKIVFYSQGIGPVNKWWNRLLIKKVTSQVEQIFVREKMSEKLLKDIGVTVPISVAIDPVFGIELNKTLQQAVGTSLTAGKKVGVYLRPWRSDKAMMESVKEGLLHLIQEGYEVYMLSMQYEQDISIAKQIASKVNSPKLHVVDRALSVDETLAYTANFDFIISMRLHSLIMGVAVGIPVIALSYDPKVENVMNEMEIHHHIRLEELNSKKLVDKIKWMQENIEKEKLVLKEMHQRKVAEIYVPIHYIKKSLERNH